MIFSYEWRQKQWGCSHILEDIHRRGKLGRQQGNHPHHHNNNNESNSADNSESAFYDMSLTRLITRNFPTRP
jgi:hypothetical protein